MARWEDSTWEDMLEQLRGIVPLQEARRRQGWPETPGSYQFCQAGASDINFGESE